MADKLVVKDFGPIENAELDIKKVTVLIGPQGSGKSTLAKLVAMFKDKDFFGGIGIRNFRKYDYDFFGLDSFVKKNSQISFDNQYFSLSYSLNEFVPKLNDELDLKVSKKVEERTEELINAKVPFSINTSQGLFKSEKNSNIRIIITPIIGSAYNSLNIPKTNYIPTERFLISSTTGALWGLMSNNIALAKYITDFGSQFEIARNTLLNHEIDFLNIAYKYENGVDKVVLSNNNEIKLSVSASGFQSIIPLRLVIENKFTDDLTHFIIEEPELNLFPITQRHLVQYLVEKCTFNKNELLITTHSPYVLSSLNLLVFAYKTAQKHPERETEIEAIIPKKFWINPDDFAAYYVADGTARSIINEKTGLISENELDGVSDLIGDDFDTLMEIYKTPQHEAVN